MTVEGIYNAIWIRKLVVLLCFIATCFISESQTLTFSEHIAPIIYKNCTPCHKKGEAGPFTLETYEDVKKNARLIKYVVENRIMPPWKADPAYRHFKNERLLSDTEVKTISSWINSNCPNSNDGLGKTKYSKTTNQAGSLSGTPDLIIKMPKPHLIKAKNKDEFVIYVVKVKLSKDQFIKATHIVPGNRRLVHHIGVECDTLNRFDQAAKDAVPIYINEFETIYPSLLPFPASYAPGNATFTFPDQFWYKIHNNTNLIFRLHYAPSTKEETDQSEIHIYFNNNAAALRTVTYFTHSMAYEPGQKYLLAADRLDTIVLTTPAETEDLSVLAIQPHMHLLGKSFKIFAITPTDDTIPMVNVNNWDFYWQTNYFYSIPIRIPKGSYFKAEIVYDNTANNIRNPFNPPRSVLLTGGMNSYEEMCQFIVYQTPYMECDETLPLY